MHLQQFSPFLVISSSVHVHNTRSRVNSQIKVTSPCSIVGETNVGLTALQHSVVLPNSCEANISGVQRRRWARIFPNLHEAIPWSRNYVDENEHEYFQISSKLFHEAIPWSYSMKSQLRWRWRKSFPINDTLVLEGFLNSPKSPVSIPREMCEERRVYLRFTFSYKLTNTVSVHFSKVPHFRGILKISPCGPSQEPVRSSLMLTSTDLQSQLSWL